MSRAKLTWCLLAVILSAASVAAQELQPPLLPLPAPTPEQLLGPHPIVEIWGREAPPVHGTYSIPQLSISPAEFQVPHYAPDAPPAPQAIFESPLIDTPGLALAVSPSNSPLGRPDHYGCKGCGEAACDVCSSGGIEPCHHCRGCACSGRIEHWWQTRAKPCLQESHWGYAEQFEEKPFGASLRAHMNTQVCNGTKDRMVLYRYDFHEGILGPADKLNPHGQRRLTELARMLRCNIFPLVIEPSLNDPALDTARRDHVLELLKDSTFECPEDWVVVRRPNAKGLSGEDAMQVYKNLMSGAQPAASTGGATIGISMSPQDDEATE
jgi:hypothetical protein